VDTAVAPMISLVGTVMIITRAPCPHPHLPHHQRVITNTPQPDYTEALGRQQRFEAHGIPPAITPTCGNRHDVSEAVLKQPLIRR